MTVCIFLGPTLALADARSALEATYLPPVRQGDIYRIVSLLRPRVVGVIDGYFQWVPSVWHKEILWALREGVHVFGAASMGALRAAELAPFGMRGVGRIFAAYRDGVLDGCGDEPFEDDDEVAVEHAPGEIGYVATSEAMVNIRCTLANAEAGNVISAATRARCIDIAKQLFFPERSYDAVLERVRGVAPAAEVAALQAWLADGRINQKRIDALALLAAIRKFLEADPAPARPAYAFEHTTLWERAILENAPETAHGRDEQRVLEELRLDGRQWQALRREVLSALAAVPPSDAERRPGEWMQRLAARHGEPQEVARLIDELAQRQALRGTIEDIAPVLIERQVLERVRSTGQYERLLARSEDKHARNAARRDLPDVDEFSDLQLLQLRDWYFTQAFGAEMPDDIEQFVHAWGYRNLTDFHRAIFAEHVYLRTLDEDKAAETGRAAGELA